MKTKRLTKFGAVLSAALVLLSGILSVSAASVPPVSYTHLTLPTKA